MAHLRTYLWAATRSDETARPACCAGSIHVSAGMLQIWSMLSEKYTAHSY